MFDSTPSSALPAVPIPDQMGPSYLAAMSFLSRYLNPATIEAYKIDLGLYFTWCHSQMRIDPIAARKLHVQAYVHHLVNIRCNGPATIARRVGTVTRYYEHALDEGYIDATPCRKIVLPKIQDDPSLPWLDRFEMANLMHAAAASRNRSDEALVALMMYVGMRVSAACNVQVEDIQTLRVGYKVVRTQGKGGKILELTLPIPMYEALDRAIDGRARGSVFIRPRSGKQCNRRQAAEMLRKLARHAGLDGKRVTPHALRRSFATLGFDAQIAGHVMQEGLGHASIKTSLHYNRRRTPAHASATHTIAAIIAGVN